MSVFSHEQETGSQVKVRTDEDTKASEMQENRRFVQLKSPMRV